MGRLVFFNNLCLYDNEIRVRRTVQINALMTTLKLVKISYARTVAWHWAHNVGPAILLFITEDVGVNFQVTVFRRFVKVITEDGPENATEVEIIREAPGGK